MPRGKNYVNNNRGVFLQAHKSKSAKMELCHYGAGCTRRDCFYLHPTRDTTTAAATPAQSKSNEPCLAYLAGQCAFTDTGCRKRHPPPDECQRLVAKYRTRPCRFGSDCQTNGCLYIHPGEEGYEQATTPVFYPVTATTTTTVVAPEDSAAVAWLNALPPVPIPGTAWRPAPPTTPSAVQRLPSSQARSAPLPTSTTATSATSMWSTPSSTTPSLLYSSTTTVQQQPQSPAEYPYLQPDSNHQLHTRAREFIPGQYQKQQQQQQQHPYHPQP
jgi:hypothetical protein